MISAYVQNFLWDGLFCRQRKGEKLQKFVKMPVYGKISNVWEAPVPAPISSLGQHFARESRPIISATTNLVCIRL